MTRQERDAFNQGYEEGVQDTRLNMLAVDFVVLAVAAIVWLVGHSLGWW